MDGDSDGPRNGHASTSASNPRRSDYDKRRRKSTSGRRVEPRFRRWRVAPGPVRAASGCSAGDRHYRKRLEASELFVRSLGCGRLARQRRSRLSTWPPWTTWASALTRCAACHRDRGCERVGRSAERSRQSFGATAKREVVSSMSPARSRVALASRPTSFAVNFWKARRSLADLRGRDLLRDGSVRPLWYLMNIHRELRVCRELQG